MAMGVRVLELLLAASLVTAAMPDTIPEQVILEPRTEAQVQALRSTDPEVLYSGRKWGGKSWLAIAKSFTYASVYPGARCLISRKERASMDNTTLDVAREVIPPSIWIPCWREKDSCLLLPNKSRIDVRGLNEPDRIAGSRYGFACTDQGEQLSARDYELVNSCVGQAGMPFHQFMNMVNPSSPGHHLYRRFQPDLGDGLRPDPKTGEMSLRVIRVGRDDLMDTIEPGYLARLNRMTGVWYKQLRLGQWCAFEGQVFGGVWDPVTMANVEPPAEWAAWGGYPPPDWDRIRGIDFGMDHPAVCVWLAQGPGSDKLWIYRQAYMSNRSPRQNALTIKALELRELKGLRAACPEGRARELEPQLAALNVTESWSDHDRGERETYAEEGVWTQPADKEVEAGLGTVAEAMASGMFVTVRGNLAEADQRLLELELPTCFEEEVLQYSRPRADEDGHFKGREGVVKRDDHAIDAVRYALHSRRGMREVRVYA
jgi:hypothetical protein